MKRCLFLAWQTTCRLKNRTKVATKKNEEKKNKKVLKCRINEKLRESGVKNIPK